MCQYSALHGVPNDWHMVHLGSRAVGGAGLVIAEATAVTAEGRISPGDLGIWNDQQVKAFQAITSFIAEQGSVPGIQLAHAGRKASTAPPWKGGRPVKISDGGWQPVAPTAVSFDDEYPSPRELSQSEIAEHVSKFAEAALRSLDAGFKVIELHMAHGYLMHEFLSPLTNKRTDEYGGSLEGRAAVSASRRKSSERCLAVGASVVRSDISDGLGGGRMGFGTVREVCEMATRPRHRSDRLLQWRTCPARESPVAPGYQVPFAATIRRESTCPPELSA